MGIGELEAMGAVVVAKSPNAKPGLDEAVCWTDLKLAQQVLARAGYRRRSLRKGLITGDVDPHERDRQFRLIATLAPLSSCPRRTGLCLDTKKKERLDHLHRLGSCYSTDVQFVYEHDYRHLATGVLGPSRGV